VAVARGIGRESMALLAGLNESILGREGGSRIGLPGNFKMG
jgi:hypothetical protein